MQRRLAVTLAGFGALAFFACLLAPLVGSTPIHLARVFDRSIPFGDNVDAQIFFVARLPRVLAAALVGSGLALAGVVFQALLRNPLASPDTLGVSAGAALGAMLAITFHADFTLLSVSAVPLASFAGSIGALAMVYGLSAARRRGQSTMVLLLAGVTLTALLSAVVRFVQYLADFTATFQTVRWLMGALDVAGYSSIVAALVPMAIAIAGYATLPRVLDLMSLGSRRRARGVDVKRAERIALSARRFDRRGRVARRTGRVRWHHRAPSRPADRRRGSSLGAAGVSALRRGFSRRLRSRRPHRARTGRVAGRHRHRDHWRAVLFMAAVPKSLRALVVVLAFVMGRASSAPTQPAHDASLLRAPFIGVGAEFARPVAAPHRVISLVPATTEMLFAMGAGSVVVGVTSYDTYPPEVAALPKLGGLLDPNVERIFSLKPDLVIVYNTQAELKQQLERAGIPMFPYVHRDLPDVTATIRSLGERVGFAAQANTLSDGMERKLGDIRSRVAGRPRPRTLLIFGRQQARCRTSTRAGGYGFLHDMLEAAGGNDAVGDITRESVQMTTEMVLARARRSSSRCTTVRR